MNDSKQEILILLRHYWKQNFKATDAVKRICEVEGDGIVQIRVAQKWFKRFSDGDITLQRSKGSGRRITVDNDAIRAAVEAEPTKSCRNMAVELSISKSSIHSHLHQLGKVNKCCREVPHELTPENAKRRISICKKLLDNPQDFRFLKRIVTSDEKWIYYRYSDNRKQWIDRGASALPVVRRERFEKKALLCCWWNIDGVIHFEVIPDGRAINSEMYSNQLHRVHDVLEVRYPALVNRNRVILQQDNAKPHTSKRTSEKVNELGFEILPHPAYSPDLAPSDYYLFRSMAHFLRGRRFANDEEVRNGCKEFFYSKEPAWYRKGIEMLAERWVKTIDYDGMYFDD